MTRLNSLTSSILLRHLVDTERGMSIMELTEVTGLGRESLSGHIQMLHRRGLIYVTAHVRDRDGLPYTRLFKWGVDVPDAERPVGTTQQERCRAYKQRIRLIKQSTKGTLAPTQYGKMT